MKLGQNRADKAVKYLLGPGDYNKFKRLLLETVIGPNAGNYTITTAVTVITGYGGDN